MRKLVILIHRYLGIGLALVFVLWFASGFAIIYTGGMPTLTEHERLARLPNLDLGSISISPSQAQRLVTASSPPKLTTVMGRTAYQFSENNGGVVFADDGSILSSSMISSSQIISDFIGVEDKSIERIGRIEEVDQWTIGLRGELPLEKFRVIDDAGTEVYVSPRWGQVILVTTSMDRFLAWIGAIPHWLYFVDLRRNTALWSDVVIWLSSLGSILAVLGIVLIFIQLRSTTPFSFRKAIPYKDVMRWHYITGLCFGLVTLTWVFSGLLSMDPYEWTRARGLTIDRSLLQGGDLELQRFDELNQQTIRNEIYESLAGAELKEIEFKLLQGNYYISAIKSDTDSTWGFGRQLIRLDGLETKQDLFDTGYIIEQLGESQAAAIVSTDILREYDSYYYSRASTQGPSRPLPVLRVRFDDSAGSTVYVDLNSSEVVFQSNDSRRMERWLYNGFHSLDFGFWYGSRPIWDIVVILLLSGGLVLAVIGTYIGIRRLYLNTREMFS